MREIEGDAVTILMVPNAPRAPPISEHPRRHLQEGSRLGFRERSVFGHVHFVNTVKSERPTLG
jgi:hypothetical protein